jgi:hypothetical protein
MGDSLRQHDLHQVRRVSPDGDLSGGPRPCQNVSKMNRSSGGVKQERGKQFKLAEYRRRAKFPAREAKESDTRDV